MGATSSAAVSRFAVSRFTVGQFAMDESLPQFDEPNRLSQITTLWSVVRRAHGTQTVIARQAKAQLLDRYGEAIHRYLGGALRDESSADDAYQNFAVDFLAGKLASADEQRGQFRSFLKVVLYRIVANHHRRRSRDKLAGTLEGDVPEPSDKSDEGPGFDQSWRNVLLRRTWQALQAMEEETGRPLYTALRLRVERPNAASTEMAQQLSTQLGRAITSTHFRVWLHRAREKFAALLLSEVRQSLDAPDRETIEQELSELELLDYCRQALEKSKFD